MTRAIITRRLVLGMILAVLAASTPPLRASVLQWLGATDLPGHHIGAVLASNELSPR